MEKEKKNNVKINFPVDYISFNDISTTIEADDCRGIPEGCSVKMDMLVIISNIHCCFCNFFLP